MTAQEKLAVGAPDEALIELQNEIRARPEDPKLRIFLFQLHCLLGNWSKALLQLQVIAGIDPETMLLAQIFQPVINCEALIMTKADELEKYPKSPYCMQACRKDT